MAHHGVLRLTDAPRFGLSPGAMSKYAARHGWRRPYDGVVVLPGAPDTYEQRAASAVSGLGHRVVAARQTAAYLWGMVREPPPAVHLVLSEGRHASARPGLDITHSGTLRRRDVSTVRAIPVTSPGRTVVDLARALSVDALRNLVIDARQRRLVTLEEITEAASVFDRVPGGAKLRRVLADLDEEDCDSVLEWRFRELLRAEGLRPYPRPFPFRCDDGVVIEIDVAFPQHWVACECDGLSSRAERRALTTHHRRQNAAVASGWAPFLVDWTRLTSDPRGLVADLRALLTASDLSRAPAPPADASLVDPRYRGRRRRVAP